MDRNDASSAAARETEDERYEQGEEDGEFLRLGARLSRNLFLITRNLPHPLARLTSESRNNL